MQYDNYLRQCSCKFAETSFVLLTVLFICAVDKRKQQHTRVKLAYFIVHTDGQRPVVKLRIG